MKITQVNPIKLKCFPKNPPRDGLAGISSRDVFLVQIMTDEGIEGIGEGFALGCLDSLEPITNETLKMCIRDRYFGAGRKKSIEKAIGGAYAVAAATALVLTTICFLAAGPVIEGFLQTPPEMSGESRSYYCIYSTGLIFQFIYNVTYGILRAHGDSKGGLIFLFLSSVMNVFLDLLLVAVIPLGVAGAAVATVASQAV